MDGGGGGDRNPFLPIQNFFLLLFSDGKCQSIRLTLLFLELVSLFLNGPSLPLSFRFNSLSFFLSLSLCLSGMLSNSGNEMWSITRSIQYVLVPHTVCTTVKLPSLVLQKVYGLRMRPLEEVRWHRCTIMRPLKCVLDVPTY